MRFIALIMMILLLAGCEKAPRTKVDDSLTAALISDQIHKLKYDMTALDSFETIQTHCNTPKQQCKQTGTVKPDGTFTDCITLTIPECSQLKPIAQSIADTIAGCTGNNSSFCAEFFQQAQGINPVDLPASTQKTYGLTLDTPYFHGSRWGYWTELYPWPMYLLKAVLYFLMIMPWVYLAIRYYLRRRSTTIFITAPLQTPVVSESEFDQQQASEAALKRQQEAQEAAKQQEIMRKQAEQKKRENEALKAAEEAEKQQQAQLAQEEITRKRLEAAKQIKNMFD